MGNRFLHLACQGDCSRPCPPIRDATGHICGMYHIINIVTMPWVSQRSMFNCTYMQQIVRQNLFIQTLQLKLKTKAFLYVRGMDSTDIE